METCASLHPRTYDDPGFLVASRRRVLFFGPPVASRRRARRTIIIDFPFASRRVRRLLGARASSICAGNENRSRRESRSRVESCARARRFRVRLQQPNLKAGDLKKRRRPGFSCGKLRTSGDRSSSVTRRRHGRRNNTLTLIPAAAPPMAPPRLRESHQLLTRAWPDFLVVRRPFRAGRPPVRLKTAGRGVAALARWRSTT